MNPLFARDLYHTRRQFFGDSGLRLGGLALSILAGRAAAANAAAPAERVQPSLPGLPHSPPKAKSLIYLHMNGGPAQMDLWDYKPQLA